MIKSDRTCHVLNAQYVIGVSDPGCHTRPMNEDKFKKHTVKEVKGSESKEYRASCIVIVKCMLHFLGMVQRHI